MSKYAEFLAGERHEDVAVFIHAEATTDLDALADHGTEVDDGMVIVVPGDRGRSVFQSVAGLDPMGLASEARGTEGHVDRDLAGGDCPSAAEGAGSEGAGSEGDDSESATADADHFARFVFAFSEAQNEDVDGIYTEGDVMHAYVQCACGTTYGDKWLLEDATE